MRHNFNDSQFAKFFNSKYGQELLHVFVTDTDIIKSNYGWYKEQGSRSNVPTPVAIDGTATFSVGARSLEAAPLMDLRSPNTDTNQKDLPAMEVYTASIPNFAAKGTVENALERDYRLKIYEELGALGEQQNLDYYAALVQEKVDSVDVTLNFLTAQLMSTGKNTYAGIGQGIQAPLQKAPIPAANFKTAGALVWTDESCDILKQMATIEQDIREEWGYTGAMVWQVSRDMYYNVILQNAAVKEFISNFRTLNYIATATNMVTTAEMFNQAIVDYNGLSPIIPVMEKERNITNTGDAFINGWEQTAAVLRPAGDAVQFMWAENVDQKVFQKYGSKLVDKVWAKTNDGLGTLVNTTLNNGNLQEWHTDLFLDAIPALVEFPYHVIVDTATADE